MVSSNLAFSFARQAELRTVLIDLDLRRPQLSKTLGLQPGPSMATFLNGTADPTSQFVRFQNNLAIGASSSSQKQSSELLTGSQTKRSIDALFDALQPDVVLYDMPPLLASDDTLAFLPNVDCTLLIIEADRTTVSEVDEAEQILAEKSSLLGVVLNKSRFEADSYAYYYD
jgi:protein-tyrosine kinase